MEENKKDMIPKLIGETWRKYPTETSKQKATYGLFECQYCKKEFETQTINVRRGRTKSCGCQRINKTGITHGLTQHRFYNTWNGVIQRCNNPNHNRYKDYGGRGITVCEEWLDVRNFVAWCDLTRPDTEGLSLDRTDVDGNYEPTNCRWADASTQSLNQRISKSNTSGFVGVDFKPNENKYVARITVLGNRVYIGTFLTIEEAVQARDNYIIENELPHKLSGLTKN